MSDNAPKPWERLPDETDKAWNAFVLYRDAGVSRSCENVAKLLQVVPRALDRWRKRYQWQVRTAAWDAEKDKAALEADRNSAKKIRELQLKVGHVSLTAGMLIAQKILKHEMKDPDGVTKQTAKAAASLIEVGAKMLNLNSDLPTERVDNRVSGTVTAQTMTEAMRNDTYRAGLDAAIAALDAVEGNPGSAREDAERGEVAEGATPEPTQH